MRTNTNTLLLLVVGFLLAWALIGQSAIQRDLARLSQPLFEQVAVKMQSVTYTYVSAGGTIVVTTPKNPGESDEAWAIRHREAVVAMKEQFPPDPE